MNVLLLECLFIYECFIIKVSYVIYECFIIRVSFFIYDFFY